MARKHDPFVVSGAAVVSPGQARRVCDVLVEDGRIRAVGRVPRAAGLPRVAGAGKTLIPGLIDVHLQGAGGSDVLDGTPEALATVSRTAAAAGTTSFLATTVFFPGRKDQRHISAVRAAMAAGSPGAEILGIHLEGPYISRVKTGMIQPQCIALPSELPFARIAEACGTALSMMTVAPEVPGARGIARRLLDAGAVPAVGHTDADWRTTRRFLDLGVTHVTHLFNAMRSFHHREPGALGAVLMDGRTVCQIIPDGNHVHEAILAWLYRLKGVDGLCLITDGMPPMLARGRRFTYLGLEYRVRNGAAWYNNGTLIGSATGQLDMLGRFARFAGVGREELLASATTTPARVLGLGKRKGRIAPGMDADMVLVDAGWRIEKTWVGGRLVFERRRR